MTKRIKGFDVLTQRAKTLDDSKIILVRERYSPLIISLPHSGTWIPDITKAHLEHSRLLLLDTDLLTDQIFEPATRIGSSIKTSANPYVVNCNRGFTKPTLPLIPNQLLSGTATLLHPYTKAEQTHILSTYYQAYHKSLQQLIRQARKNFGFALVIDGHGMGRTGAVHTKDPGGMRPDMAIGDNFSRAANTSISQALSAHLEASGYRPAYNKPYSGGHITRAYGDPKNRIYVVQIELAKDLYMREIETEYDLTRRPLIQTSSGLPKLKKALTGAIQAAVRAAAVA
ncbi:MAG: N-formylglutamate amidohydrolase [bacterium]|nr:N-formylglutamate amidohydrolase [bacterium]